MLPTGSHHCLLKQVKSPLPSDRAAEGGTQACFHLLDQITYWDRSLCLRLVSVFSVLPKRGDALGPAQGGQVGFERVFKPLVIISELHGSGGTGDGVQLEMHLLSFTVSLGLFMVLSLSRPAVLSPFHMFLTLSDQWKHFCACLPCCHLPS